MFHIFKKKTPLNKCPNCSIALETRPTRKTKCKSCQKFIYVRTDPQSRKQLLVTESQKNTIDLEWQAIPPKSRINWKQELERWDITEKDFEIHKEKMAGKTKQNIGDMDVVWSLLGELLHESASMRDFQKMSTIQYTQALFYNEEGRDPFKILQASSLSQLTAYKSQGYATHVQIISGDKSCPSCQKHNGAEYTLEEAISNSPIPCKDCSFTLEDGKFSFCRCCYSASHKR